MWAADLSIDAVGIIEGLFYFIAETGALFVGVSMGATIIDIGMTELSRNE